MTPLIGHDQTVGEWVGKKLNKQIVQPYTAIGWIDADGTLKGGAVFNNWNGSNIEITIYGPGAFRRGSIVAAINYVFRQLNAHRLTATTERANKTMRRMLPRMGFKFESVQPKFYGPLRRNDGIVFRMLRADTRKWLK